MKLHTTVHREIDGFGDKALKVDSSHIGVAQGSLSLWILEIVLCSVTG